MELPLVMLIGVFFAAAVYLMLSKFLVRVLLGVVLLGNGVNLLLFTNGRILREVPPIIPAGYDVPVTLTANPLPQALILTAIVISFSFFAFLLVLVYRAYQDLGTDNGNEMRVAEPENDPLPPTGY
ncbi:Na+/H+ antiporter subunit C [Sinorhizobium sp. RAC02]|uniref:Na+/H+ antiporter subunit C n=1 Tax=Sinorhizobium sp. RAC02 TaxID=1842534 RepID=UPI00083E6774|nr:Na+/H+ antiporter subunit C [Sinorhizobium sp. RAC02]AOF89869.1 NADH-ubiquinone/plastoquinone oxidoreductase chain 4L family protein [Sinorhizobium sp. RAC02]